MLRGEIPVPPVARTIGFRLTHAEAGTAVFVLDARMDTHANPMGTLHGGVLCDVADAAMGTAYGMLLAEGETMTTLELKINFLRPVWDATLTATGRVIWKGATVGMAECDIADERGRLIARASSTVLTLSGAKALGR